MSDSNPSSALPVIQWCGATSLNIHVMFADTVAKNTFLNRFLSCNQIGLLSPERLEIVFVAGLLLMVGLIFWSSKLGFIIYWSLLMWLVVIQLLVTPYTSSLRCACQLDNIRNDSCERILNRHRCGYTLAQDVHCSQHRSRTCDLSSKENKRYVLVFPEAGWTTFLSVEDCVILIMEHKKNGGLQPFHTYRTWTQSGPCGM